MALEYLATNFTTKTFVFVHSSSVFYTHFIHSQPYSAGTVHCEMKQHSPRNVVLQKTTQSHLRLHITKLYYVHTQGTIKKKKNPEVERKFVCWVFYNAGGLVDVVYRVNVCDEGEERP